jgi:arginyl-tRNA--protein-N-Asp/Glu arginylyltransferase
MCWIGHCDKMRYKQRHERARILKVFANETVAATERILHHYWVVELREYLRRASS